MENNQLTYQVQEMHYVKTTRDDKVHHLLLFLHNNIYLNKKFKIFIKQS